MAEIGRTPPDISSRHSTSIESLHREYKHRTQGTNPRLEGSRGTRRPLAAPTPSRVSNPCSPIQLSEEVGAVIGKVVVLPLYVHVLIRVSYLLSFPVCFSTTSGASGRVRREPAAAASRVLAVCYPASTISFNSTWDGILFSFQPAKLLELAHPTPSHAYFGGFSFPSHGGAHRPSRSSRRPSQNPWGQHRDKKERQICFSFSQLELNCSHRDVTRSKSNCMMTTSTMPRLAT